QVWLKNLHIKPYDNAGYAQHEADRERKLLLKKREIAKLKKGLDQQGWTIVPLKLFFNSRNFARIEIALASGKKAHDKRDTIKKRDVARDIQRQLS
ncbi:MAG: SsrA-binding protein, partial [Bacteroidota bacterium]